MSFKRGIKFVSLALFLMLVAQTGFKVKADTGTTIVISQAGQVVDSFNGVSAIYRPGPNDGTDSTYSCAAYIWKYYKAVYGITVYNLFYNQVPLAYGTNFIEVTTPQPGDICAQVKPATQTNHWSIVKSVGNGTVTVIEQNFKWQSGGTTYAYVNHSYAWSEVKFYRMASATTGSINTTNVSQQTTQTVATTQSQPAQATASSVGTATKVKLSHKDVTIAKKEKFRLKAKLTPATSTDAIKFTSSNTKVAKVSKWGTVTGKKVGKCKITAKAASGKKKTCIVRVIKKWSK